MKLGAGLRGILTLETLSKRPCNEYEEYAPT